VPVVDVDAGIVDEDIEPADFVADIIADAADIGRLGQIAGLYVTP
jgi:hypothetical protein